MARLPKIRAAFCAVTTIRSTAKVLVRVSDDRWRGAVDRAEECRALDRLLDVVRGGHSATLVLEGEPGIGKTALLGYAAQSAADLRVLRLTGVEPEVGLDHAGLHQLLRPFLSRVDRLRQSQRQALRAALGLGAGATPDRFLVGLGVLTLLASVAEEHKLLILVDDAHWLDEETLQALAFVARRLEAEAIGLLFATRHELSERVSLDGLPVLELGGLPPRAARKLIVASASGPVDDAVGERLIRATGGNPLALAELSRELSASQLSGLAPLPDPIPIGRRLEQAFLRRAASLPPDSRFLLLLVAAEGTAEPCLVWQVAARLGIGSEAADAAEQAGLLVLHPCIGFRHPLIRSAVYAGASPGDRRRAHAALAAEGDPKVDCGRRAWHQALAAVGPDERVAADLEQAADCARRRGGYATSAAFLERAAALTPDSRRRAERLLAAAQAELMRGAPDRACELLDEAAPRLCDPLRHAQALRLRGAISFDLGRVAEATRALIAAAAELEPLDAPSARRTLLEALEAAHIARDDAGEGTLAAVAKAARAALGRAISEPTLCDLLLAGFGARASGCYAEAAPPLRQAIEALRRGGPSDEERLRWLGVGCGAAADLLEEEAGDALARQWVALARHYGAVTTLSQALSFLGVSEAFAGRLDAADACFAERLELNAAIGLPGIVGRTAPHHLIVLAWRGRESEARANAEAVTLDAAEGRLAAPGDFADYALSVLDVGLGRYDTARNCALRVFEHDPPYCGTRVLPELVEAAIRVGDHDAASAAVERLSEHVRANPTPCARGLLARSRAQLGAAGGVDVEVLHLEAIEALQGRLLAPELARSHLLYGEWLRRRRRRIDARRHLRVAYEMLDAIGAEGFAERARMELLATGAKARKRTHETRDGLTQQELRVAWLAAEGASNAEIAAQLFISPSTVAYHLHKTFRKLDVSARTQLARLLLHAQQPEEVHGGLVPRRSRRAA